MPERCPVSSLDILEKTCAQRSVVGGRILTRDPTGFVLADALASAHIQGVVDAERGDLVVVEIERELRHVALEAPAPQQGLETTDAWGGQRRPEKLEGASVSDASFHLVRLVSRHRPAAVPEGRTESWRLIEQGIGHNLRVRATALELVRRFFRRRGFIEVDTPALVPSPGLDLHLDAIGNDEGWLATSPEYQMKRLLAGGLPRVFQLSHVFRKGEVGARHNPEFTMVEWYRAFAGVEEVMDDTEQLVRMAARELAGTLAVRVGSTRVDLAKPFQRLTVPEAFERHAGVSGERALELAAAQPDEFFRLLVEHVEPALAGYEVAVFLHDYPISQASLARPCPSDPRLAERFELYVGGVELSNGFGELVDPVEQRARLVADQAERRKVGKTVYPIDERFLDALAWGMPPSGGNALGFDRLLAVCLGESEIGRCMPFPAGWL